jgi:hypothetical protein
VPRADCEPPTVLFGLLSIIVGPFSALAELSVLLLFIQFYKPDIPPKLLTLGATKPVPEAFSIGALPLFFVLE